MDDLKHDIPPTIAAPQRERPSYARVSWWRSLSWRAIAGIVIVVVIVGVIAWRLTSGGAQKVPTGRFAAGGPMPVVTATVEQGSIDIIYKALGTVTPLATVTVKTQISGQIMRIDFKEGQKVNKGDLLAEIDNRPYLLQLDQAQGQLLRDQALLKTAQLDLERYRTLAAQDSIARQQLDTQEQLVRQYEGVVKTDQGQVDSANLNLMYCNITAPVAGRAGLRSVDVGNYAQTSDANGIVVITQTQPISVIFTLPEDNLQPILKQLHAGATLGVTAFDRSQTTQLATGTLSTIDNQMNTATGTFRLRGEFKNDDESLFPNQFVNIELLADTVKDVPVIPTAAVQRGSPGTFVFVVNADDTVSVHPIKLGASQGEKVEVTSGLAPGDKIVVDGADKLRDKTKVSPRDPSNPNNAAAAPASGDKSDDASGDKSGDKEKDNSERRQRRNQQP
jgi:multidrug efflux system membrane fusion protein